MPSTYSKSASVTFPARDTRPDARRAKSPFAQLVLRVHEQRACPATRLRLGPSEERCHAAKGPLEFKGIFSNEKEMRGDHLAFFILRDFEKRRFVSNMEIADAQFFFPHDLPERVNGGSRRRIAEIVENKPVSLHW